MLQYMLSGKIQDFFRKLFPYPLLEFLLHKPQVSFLFFWYSFIFLQRLKKHTFRFSILFPEQKFNLIYIFLGTIITRICLLKKLKGNFSPSFDQLEFQIKTNVHHFYTKLEFKKLRFNEEKEDGNSNQKQESRNSSRTYCC